MIEKGRREKGRRKEFFYFLGGCRDCPYYVILMYMVPVNPHPSLASGPCTSQKNPALVFPQRGRFSNDGNILRVFDESKIKNEWVNHKNNLSARSWHKKSCIYPLFRLIITRKSRVSIHQDYQLKSYNLQQMPESQSSFRHVMFGEPLLKNTDRSWSYVSTILL